MELFLHTPPRFVSDGEWNFIKLYEQFTVKGLSNSYKPKDFIKALGLTVCPYCNRQYITSGEKRRIAELDHFYPKKIKDGEELLGKIAYPYLAMSFYNLIPSCPSCNRVKSNDRILVSPYLIQDSDSYIKLNYRPLNGEFLDDKNQIEITITEEESSENSYKSRLELEEHYSYHNDYVYDLLKKKEMYDDSYLNELFNDRNDLFKSKDEIHRALWGNYTSKEDLHKRPLPKLTRDILKEIDPDLLDD